MGDFNSILNAGEKRNGQDVTPYETKDLFDCCMDSGLSDLPSIGCYCTWTDDSIWSKLDRAMVNSHWLMKGLYGQATFLPSGCLSDHSPCIVSIFQPDRSRSKPFKFYNMWANHVDFNNLVNSEWQQYIEWTEQFVFCKKLQSLKHPLRQLNTNHFGHISS